MDKTTVLTACFVLLVLEASAWPYHGRRGNRWGGWTPGQVDKDGFGLSEGCTDILAIASDELSDISKEMPAHYKELVPELQAVFMNDFLDYPIEADAKLYDAIGQLSLAAESIESTAQIPLSMQCKRQLMLALKKLNSALSEGIMGLQQLEQAVAGRENVPQEKLQEWTGAFNEALAVRNDILGCFITVELNPEGGDGEGGDGGQIPEGGDGSQNPPALP